MNPAAHLYQLQKKDSRSNWIENRMAEINLELENDTVLAQAQSKEKAASAALEIARSELGTIEAEVQAVRIKVQTSEAALYGGRIHNPKELQDIQNEIASLKRRIVILEDNQLAAMLQVEEAEAAYLLSTQQLHQTTSETTQNQAGLRGELSSLGVEKLRLLVERQMIIQQLSPERVDLYERLRKQKRGIAVVSAQDNTCSGCGTTLRPAEIQTARTSSELVICSTCGRIIYAG